MNAATIEKVGDDMLAVTLHIQGEMRDEGFTDVTLLMAAEEVTWKSISRNLRAVGWTRQQAKLLTYDILHQPEVLAIRANSDTLGTKRRAGAAE